MNKLTIIADGFLDPNLDILGQVNYKLGTFPSLSNVMNVTSPTNRMNYDPGRFTFIALKYMIIYLPLHQKPLAIDTTTSWDIPPPPKSETPKYSHVNNHNPVKPSHFSPVWANSYLKKPNPFNNDVDEWEDSLQRIQNEIEKPPPLLNHGSAGNLSTIGPGGGPAPKTTFPSMFGMFPEPKQVFTPRGNQATSETNVITNPGKNSGQLFDDGDSSSSQMVSDYSDSEEEENDRDDFIAEMNNEGNPEIYDFAEFDANIITYMNDITGATMLCKFIKKENKTQETAIFNCVIQKLKEILTKSEGSRVLLYFFELISNSESRTMLLSFVINFIFNMNKRFIAV